MPIASNLSYLGVAKETTKGTGVAATAYIPIKSFDPIDQVTYLEDTGMRGSMVDTYNAIQGPKWSEHSVSGDVFPDSIPWLISGINGDLATTGASAPFTHTMAVKNTGDGQPGSITLSDFYGITGSNTRQYAGCQVTELGFKFQGDGMFEWDAKLSGLASTLVAKPTATFGTITPQPGWLGAFSIGGSSKTFMEQGEINIKRAGAEPLHTVDGTQAPYGIWVGGMQVDGKVTFIHEDDTELTRYLNGTSTALVFNWTTGAGASLVQVQCTMSKVQYTVASIKRGKEYVELEVEFKALANSTDVGATGGFSPAKWVVQNAIASGTYA